MNTLTSNEKLIDDFAAAVRSEYANSTPYTRRELDETRAALLAERNTIETLQPHQNLALARINHLARKGRFDEADAQLFRDAIVHRPGSVPHHHIWSVNGPPRDPDPEQVCDFGCGLKWKDRQEAEAHAQKASEQRTAAEEWENAKAVMSGEMPPCECTLRDKAPSAYHNAKCPRYVADKL